MVRAGLRHPAGDVPRRSRELLTANSGRDRTTRVRLRGRLDPAHRRRRSTSAPRAILQLLLGNIGRPGGGIHGPARARQHPGLHRHPDPVQPAARLHPDAARARATRTWTTFVEADAGRQGLLGQHAVVHGQPAQGLVGRRGHAPTTTSASTTCPGSPAATAPTTPCMAQLDGTCKGYFLIGENPAVGSANAKMQRLGHGQPGLAGGARLLADRERHLVEGRPGDRDRRADAPRTSAPRCSSSRPPRTPRRTAASPTPSGCCSGTTRRSSRPATRAATCGSATTSAGSSGRSWPAPPTRRDRPVLDLTWDYPIEGALDEPTPRRCCRDQRLRTPTASRCPPTPSSRTTARPRCGCWIYCGVYADGVNQAARRKPGTRAGLGRRRVGLGVAGQPPHPLQPGLRRPGRQAVERAQGAGLVGRASTGKWTGHDVPDFERRQARRTTGRPRTPQGAGRAVAATTRSSCRPTARAGCTPRPGWSTGRCPPTTSRRSRRSPTRSTRSSATRPAQVFAARAQPLPPERSTRAPRSSRTSSPPTG